VARGQDELTCALVGLARAAEGKEPGRKTDELVMQACSPPDQRQLRPGTHKVAHSRVEAKRQASAAQSTATRHLFHGDADVVSLRSTLLFGLRGMAAYAWHARVLGRDDASVTDWLYKGLRAVGEEHSVDGCSASSWSWDRSTSVLALLDEANTSAFGHPVPTSVT